MRDGISIAIATIALIAAGTWVLSMRGASARSTYCVARRHTKPSGLEVVYRSRSVGACTRYRRQVKQLGEALIVVTQDEADAENLAAVSDPQFWRDIRHLSDGTPIAVARLAMDAELLANRLAATTRRIADVTQNEPLTRVDGIPLGPIGERGHGH